MITETEEIFTNILGNEGYSFAEVKGVPDLNEETGGVELTFYIDPLQRTYVRQIIFKGNKRIKVIGFTGLDVDLAKNEGSNILIRGLRAVSDFEYELQLANMNRAMSPDLESIFLTP